MLLVTESLLLIQLEVETFGQLHVALHFFHLVTCTVECCLQWSRLCTWK